MHLLKTNKYFSLLLKTQLVVAFFVLTVFNSLFSLNTSELNSLQLKLNNEINELGKAKIMRKIAIVYSNEYKLNKATLFIDSAIHTFIKLNNDTLLAKCYTQKGTIGIYSNQIDSGVHYFLKSNQLLKKYKDSAHIFSTYMYVAGLISGYERDYIKALNYIDTAELYVTPADKKGKIYFYLVKGGIYLNLQEYKKALETTNIGIKLSKKTKTSYLASLLANKGVALDYSKDYAGAEIFYRKSIEENSLGEKYKGISYYNLAQVKGAQFQYDSALYYNGMSISIFDKIAAKQEHFQSLIGQVEIFRKLNKNDSAVYYFNKINKEGLNNYELIQYEGLSFLLNKTNATAIVVEAKIIEAKENGFLDLTQALSEKLYYYYKENGNTAKALKFLEINKETSDSLLSQQEIIEIQKQEARVIIEAKNEAIYKKEKENLVLAYSVKNQRLLIYLFVVGVLLLLLLVLFLRKSIKTKQQEIKLSATQLENEKITRKLSESNLNKAKELIQEKNKIIKELEEESISKVDVQETSEALIKKINTNNEWAQYMVEFELIYPDFVKRVIASSIENNLTKNEIRLLTLIKLNLANKEISEILYISHDSVKKSKQRLTKKFKLEENQKLSDYIILI
jgi:hypothetical protein